MADTAQAGQGSGERGFFGRRRELDALAAALACAVAGQARTVLLAGEPGIGKTRTAQELVVQAQQRGVLALWGRCPEEPGAPPYWPWFQLLRRWAALHDDSVLAATVGPAAAQIAALDAELAPRLAAVLPAAAAVYAQALSGATPPEGPVGAASPVATDPAEARFRLFDSIAGLWQRAAARQPLLLVFDDLHRADESSLRLLEFVTAQLHASPVMVLGTFRDAEVGRQHPLTASLAELGRQTPLQRLLLGGFDLTETAQLVAAAGLSASEATLLHEQTEGHPLFLVELARDLAPSRGLDRRQLRKGVRDVIGARLNQLSPPCLALLQHAAVIGREFEDDLLCQLATELTPQQRLAALDEARTSSLIGEAADTGRWQFTHALVRDGLYDEMPAPQRARLHHEIAVALESRHRADLTPSLSALAHHWHAAGPAGSAAKAIEYATRAAERASAMQAHEEAIRHYLLACAALPVAPDPRQRCRLLLGLGRAQISAGQSAIALSTFADAAACARRAPDWSLLAACAIGFGNAQWRQGGEGSKAVTLIEEALALGQALEVKADTQERVQLLSAACRALLFSNRPAEAEQAFREAVVIARRIGDPMTLFCALSAIVPGRWFPDSLPLRIAAAREALELVQRAPHLDWPIGTLTGWYGGDLMESGETALATQAARSHLAHSEATRQPFDQATATTALAMIASHEGRFAEAEVLALQALRCGERFDRENAAGIFGVQMFTLRRHQGRLGELVPVLRHFLANQAVAATWAPGLAIVHHDLGSRDAAREVFDKLAAQGFAGVPHDAIRAASLGYLAEVCAGLDDAHHAAVLYRLLLPLAERNVVFGAHTASLGSAARLLGMLAATLERWDLAQQHFEFALVFDERTGGRPWLARSRCDFAAMLLRRRGPGDADRALPLLAAAIDDATTLGMSGVEKTVLQMQQQLTAVACAKPAARTAGLTERELQVLRMVAAGKTNQEIANALCRSPATVAIHVRNILSKTQAANRAEAAAFAVRQGLLAIE